MREIVKIAAPGSTLRCVGTTLFHVFNQGGPLFDALEKGVNLELALLNDDKDCPALDQLKDITRAYGGDIHASKDSALALIKKLAVAAPKASLEIRVHDIPLFEAFISVMGANIEFMGWSQVFGRDTADKLCFSVDPGKRLGMDLAKRFESVWKGSRPVIIFKHGALQLNEWADIAPRDHQGSP